MWNLDILPELVFLEHQLVQLLHEIVTVRTRKNRSSIQN